MLKGVYEVFGVEQHASIEEIKRSYSNLVRKYRKNAEVFTFIREARDLLCEPDTRATYDSLLETVELLKTCKERKLSKNWEGTITVLKRISLEKPSESNVQQIHRLFPLLSKKLNIANLEYLIQDYFIQGQICKCQGNLLVNGDSTRATLYQLARNYFEQIAKYYPRHSQAYVEIAETYLKESDYTQAVAWAKKAILADGEENDQDFEAIHFLCHVYANSKELQKVEGEILRIIPLLPDQEAKVNASLRFIESGNEFYQAAFEQLDFLRQTDFSTQVYLFSASLVFKKAAKLFNPDSSEIEEQCNKLENFLEALNQLQAIKSNSSFPENSQRIIALAVFNYVNTDVSNINLIDSVLPSAVKSSEIPIAELVGRLKSQNTRIYELNEDFFERLQAIAQESSKKDRRTTNASERLNKINYQDFVEIVKNRYSERSGVFKEGVDRLANILEPITEKIIDEYENLQLGGLEYQSLVEKIKDRSSQDTALLQGRVSQIFKGLYNFLDPIAEQAVFTYPQLARFILPLMKKLSSLSPEEVD